MKLNFFFSILFILSLSFSCKEGCNSCNPQGTTCHICDTSLLSRSVDGKCIRIQSSIQNCASYSTDKKCASCLPTFKLINGNCEKQSSGCIKFTNQKCSKCGFGMKLIGDQCVGIVNCEEYQSGDTSCKTCAPGFLTFGVACYVSHGCINTSENGACNQCEPEYILSGYNCVSKTLTIPSGCSIINSNGKCKYCWNGDDADSQGLCKSDGLGQNNNKFVSLRQGPSKSMNSIQEPKVINLPPPTNILQSNKQTPPIQQTLNQTNYGGLMTKQTTGVKQTGIQLNNVLNLVSSNQQKNLSSRQNCRFFDESTNKCTSCNYNYYLKNNICQAVSTLCQGYNILTGQCLDCITTYSLNSDGTCSQKITTQQSFSVTSPSQSIQPTIQQITQPSYNNLPQQTKDPNCKTFDQTGLCSECFQSFFLNSSNRICSPQNSQCAKYNSQGNCLSCYQGYELTNGNCILSTSDPNCRSFNNGRCTQCSSGFYVSLDKCKIISPLCSTSDSQSGFCLSCYAGYQLQNGQCKVFMKDPNCKQYQKGSCLQCITNHFLKQGKCVPVSPLCSAFDQRNGNCMSCYQGYALSNGQCIISNQFQNCGRVQNNQCINCVNGYYLRAGQCYQVSPLCASYDSSSGFCTNCYNGYSLISGQCRIGTTIKNCKTMKDNQCIQCSSGYSMRNGNCIVLNPLCRTSALSTGDCLTCYQGYTLSEGNCTIPTNYDPNCAQKSGITCLTCINGFYISNNVCERLLKTCATYDMRSGNCTSCNIGFQVLNGECMLTPKSSDPNCARSNQNSECVQCISNFYLSRAKRQCTAISMLCMTFDASIQVCIQCQSGYFLQDGNCIYPSMGIDHQCIHYSGSYCDRCNQGYVVQNYICTRT